MMSISVALAAKDPNATVVLGRLGFAFASAIPFCVIWMVDALVSSPRVPRPRLAVPVIFGLFFVFVSLSDWIVIGATAGVPRANFVYGPAYRAFGIYFLLAFGTGLYTLLRTIKSAVGIRRLQLHYLLLSISVTGIGAVTTNLIIPLIWGTSRYSALGPYFTLFFFSFFAHAIIRYRLMDIKVVIRQGVVYVSAIIISASVFLLFADLLRILAGYDKDHVPLLEALVAAILLSIFFQPLKNRIQTSLNRYVYRETYDYQRTVREASRRLSTILD